MQKPWYFGPVARAAVSRDRAVKLLANPDVRKLFDAHVLSFPITVVSSAGTNTQFVQPNPSFIGTGVTDLVDLVSRGVKVGLGTDGGCSNNRVSVCDEMRAAALLQKVHRIDGQAIDAETCFALGTSTAGQVLRLPVGRISPGFRCDLVALDMDDPSLWPAQALEKNVVYALSSRAITDVVVDGLEVVSARRLCNVQLDEIQARVRDLTRDWAR